MADNTSDMGRVELHERAQQVAQKHGIAQTGENMRKLMEVLHENPNAFGGADSGAGSDMPVPGERPERASARPTDGAPVPQQKDDNAPDDPPGAPPRRSEEHEAVQELGNRSTEGGERPPGAPSRTPQRAPDAQRDVQEPQRVPEQDSQQAQRQAAPSVPSAPSVPPSPTYANTGTPPRAVAQEPARTQPTSRPEQPPQTPQQPQRVPADNISESASQSTDGGYNSDGSMSVGDILTEMLSEGTQGIAQSGARAMQDAAQGAQDAVTQVPGVERTDEGVAGVGVDINPRTMSEIPGVEQTDEGVLGVGVNVGPDVNALVRALMSQQQTQQQDAPSLSRRRPGGPTR